MKSKRGRPNDLGAGTEPIAKRCVNGWVSVNTVAIDL
jgi:hypothetical protein